MSEEKELPIRCDNCGVEASPGQGKLGLLRDGRHLCRSCLKRLADSEDSP